MKSQSCIGVKVNEQTDQMYHSNVLFEYINKMANNIFHLQGLREVAALLQQGCPNPVGGLAVGLVNLPGCPEVVQGFGPVAVAPFQDAAVQLNLGTVQTHLQGSLRYSRAVLIVCLFAQRNVNCNTQQDFVGKQLPEQAVRCTKLRVLGYPGLQP